MGKSVVSFLIVNYKVGELVHQAIQSIQKQVNIPYEIIVFDNASNDGSVESLQGVYEHTKVIACSENLGFGAGNNRAFEYAKGDYIFLLNPDTIVIDDSVDEMVRYLQNHPQVGLVSPKLLYADHTLQRSVRKFYRFWGSLFDNRFMNPVIAAFPALTSLAPGLVDHHKLQEVEWAKGAALLIRRTVIEEVGLFDEDFWVYGEEMDLCFRIGLAGWKKVYMPTCSIIHLEGKSTRQASAKMFLMNYKGMYLFLNKHYPKRTLQYYHWRVGLFARIYTMLFRNKEDKRELYQNLIIWHKKEGRNLVKNSSGNTLFHRYKTTADRKEKLHQLTPSYLTENQNFK